MHYQYVNLYTCTVPDGDLWDTTSLGIDVIGPIQESHRPLDKSHPIEIVSIASHTLPMYT